MTCSLPFVVFFSFVFILVAVLFPLFFCFLVDTLTSIKLVDERLVQSELPKCLHVKANQAKTYGQAENQNVTGVKKGSAKESGPRTSPESDTEAEQKKPLHSAAHCIVFAASSTAHTIIPNPPTRQSPFHPCIHSFIITFASPSFQPTSTSPFPYPVIAISIFSSFDSCFVFPNTSGRSFSIPICDSRFATCDKRSSSNEQPAKPRLGRPPSSIRCD